MLYHVAAYNLDGAVLDERIVFGMDAAKSIAREWFMNLAAFTMNTVKMPQSNDLNIYPTGTILRNIYIREI